MKADGILRVTEVLRERLEVALTGSGVPGTVFVGPLDDVAASGAALILFLYRIAPNPSLRNREHRVESAKPEARCLSELDSPRSLFPCHRRDNTRRN